MYPCRGGTRWKVCGWWHVTSHVSFVLQKCQEIQGSGFLETLLATHFPFSQFTVRSGHKSGRLPALTHSRWPGVRRRVSQLRATAMQRPQQAARPQGLKCTVERVRGQQQGPEHTRPQSELGLEPGTSKPPREAGGWLDGHYFRKLALGATRTCTGGQGWGRSSWWQGTVTTS